MEKERVEEKIEKLYFESRLEEWLIDILFDDYVESLEDFIDEIEWKIERDFDDDLKWLILKNYCTIENIKKTDFADIEKEFFEDLKKCFEGVEESEL